MITSLQVGGAQMMLYKLLSRLDRTEWQSSVISLVDRSPMGERIEALGIPVHVVGMSGRIPFPGSLFRLVRLLRRAQADVVQTWLYHADLLGGLAARLAANNAPVLWNIRMNSLEDGIDKPTTFWTVRLCARLSAHVPARIVLNSEAGRKAHEAVGYASDRTVVISNGFDLDLFRPSEEARRTIRRELGLADNTPLVGLVGRHHPHKDHRSFLAAALSIVRRLPSVHFLLCGGGVTWSNQELRRPIEPSGYRRHFHLLGSRDDLPAIQASLDVAVSASCTEGFPNVIGEAMACAVPCVATDVGASADLVRETGRVVPPRDPKSLAAACLDVLQMPRATRNELGARARSRIQQQFSIEQIAERYAELWRDVGQTFQPACPIQEKRDVRNRRRVA